MKTETKVESSPAKADSPKLKVGKPPRIAGHTATKNGKGGTAGTWEAIVAHMAKNAGTITQADLKKVCDENGDSGFARYAQGRQRLWLVPVEVKKA